MIPRTNILIFIVFETRKKEKPKSAFEFGDQKRKSINFHRLTQAA